MANQALLMCRVTIAGLVARTLVRRTFDPMMVWFTLGVSMIFLMVCIVAIFMVCRAFDPMMVWFTVGVSMVFLMVCIRAIFMVCIVAILMVCRAFDPMTVWTAVVLRLRVGVLMMLVVRPCSAHHYHKR